MSATQEEDTKHRLGGAHTNLKVKGQVNSFCAKIQVFYFSVVCKCDKAFVLPVPASDEGLAFFVLDPKPIDIYETGAEYPPYVQCLHVCFTLLILYQNFGTSPILLALKFL